MLFGVFTLLYINYHLFQNIFITPERNSVPLTSQSLAAGCETEEGAHAILPKGRQQLLAANSAAGRRELDPWSRRQDPTAFISCGRMLSRFSRV